MTFFRFPNHTMKLKTPSIKVQGKKVFWHVILHSYLCNALRKFFVKVESNWCFSKIYSEIKSTWPINSRKEEIVLSCDSKELFVHRFVKVFDQNQIHVGREIKEQAPQLTLLYRNRAVRSSHRRCCMRKLFLKFFAISTGNTGVGVYFWKNCRPLDLQPY